MTENADGLLMRLARQSVPRLLRASTVVFVAQFLLSSDAMAEKVKAPPENPPLLESSFAVDSLSWLGLDTGRLLYVAPRATDGVLEVFPVSDDVLLAAIVTEPPRLNDWSILKSAILRLLDRSPEMVFLSSRASNQPRALRLPSTLDGCGYVVCLSLRTTATRSASAAELRDLARDSLRHDRFDLAAPLAIDLHSGVVQPQ